MTTKARQNRRERDKDVRSGTRHLNMDKRLRPEQTIARVKRFASAFGITRVANLTGLDRTGIPVVMVCRPNARSSAVFNGKGVDIASAQASALMEAAETWHAENIRLPLQLVSFADLEGQLPVIDVDGLARTPASQFDRRLPILWVEGRNLMDDSAIWLPFEIVHADSRMSGPMPSGCFAMSTNGLASGNTFWKRSATPSARSSNATRPPSGIEARPPNRTPGASISRQWTMRRRSPSSIS